MSFFFYLEDAQRALELLQQYRAKLQHRHQNQNGVREGLGEEDHQLNQSLDRVIDVFQSQLFSALLGEASRSPLPTHSDRPRHTSTLRWLQSVVSRLLVSFAALPAVTCCCWEGKSPCHMSATLRGDKLVPWARCLCATPTPSAL